MVSDQTNITIPPPAAPAALPHIFVALACHDHKVHNRFMMSLVALIACGRFKVTVSSVASGGIHKARNHLAWEFLNKTDAEIYASIDADIGFHPDHASRLVQRILNEGIDVVGGPYCHKKPELEWSARAIEGKVPNPKTGLQELNALGTGFLFVRRRVFEKIRDDHPELMHIEDWGEGKGAKKWDFFSEGVVQEPIYYPEPTFLTEDFYFCKRCRDAGFPVYVDTTFNLEHWDGGRCYPEKPKQPATPTAPTQLPDGNRLKEMITP